MKDKIITIEDIVTIDYLLKCYDSMAVKELVKDFRKAMIENVKILRENKERFRDDESAPLLSKTMILGLQAKIEILMKIANLKEEDIK